MVKIFKIGFVLFFALMSFSSWSLESGDLNPYNGLTEDQKRIVAIVSESLGVDLKNESGFNWMQQSFAVYMEDNWDAYALFSPDYLKAVNLQISSAPSIKWIMQIESRSVIINTIYYKEEGILLTKRAETVPVTIRILMDIFNELKEDGDYSIVYETDNYILFQKEGYINQIAFHVGDGAGMITYYNSNYVELK